MFINKKIARLFAHIMMIPSLLGQSRMTEHFQLSDSSERLSILESQVRQDLLKINIPPFPWVLHSRNYAQVLDVAIIGGGMAGMTAAFALMKEGIPNIKIFDENNEGYEGPWLNCARMHELRSGKRYMGPAMGVASLTFWSWYEALYGKEKWEQLKMPPTKLWQDYLGWFRKALNMPIANNMKLITLNPMKDLLELTFTTKDDNTTVYARKVILATGREGAGGLTIPSYLQGVSKKFYAHTAQKVDPDILRNKCIAILGGASSAFDAAGIALENAAERVDMFVRRSSITQINKFGLFAYPGLYNGFYLLSDEMRCRFFVEAFLAGIDPSKAAVDRIEKFKNFHVHYSSQILNVLEAEKSVSIETNQGTFKADFIFLGTGYTVDLSKRPELGIIQRDIRLWKNYVPQELLQLVPGLGNFPYLGPNFEFLEAEPDTAPYLKNIYCLNYGAYLSHGPLSSDIPGISRGALQVAKGIAADFFLIEQQMYFQIIKEWDTPDFHSEDYAVLKK